MNYTLQMEITHEACCKCGVTMFMTPRMQQEFRESKETFYCLHGHPQSYTKSRVDILREKITERDHKIAELEEKLRQKKKKK